MTKIFVEEPAIFFYSLIEQSSKDYKVQLDDEVKTYVLHLLIDSIDGSTLNLKDSLSLKYLTAVHDKDEATLKVVGDSCLFMLGLLPTGRPDYNSLYYDLGIACYGELGSTRRIYSLLSSYFYQTIDVLHGVNILLERNTPYEIWEATGSRASRLALQAQNVVPLRRKR